jgi:hypothetical protein
VVKRVAVAAGKAIYKASGAQSVVSCVTDPTLSSCVQAAVAVGGAALTVATGGAGAAVDVAADAAVDATTDVAVDAAAEGASETAAEGAGAEAGDEVGHSCTVGGESFTAGTKVLLASGAAVPISQLRIGDKVVATNTKTGKTQAESVVGVLVHHDTDLYDLNIRDHGRTAVIDTTSNHLFWVPGIGGHRGRWIKAAALHYGTHLRTPGARDTAVVVGGYVPRQREGWMWDLTITPSHDFYVDTLAAAVLVHNVTCTMGDIGKPGDVIVLGRQEDTAVAESWSGHLVLNDPAWSPAGNIEWIKNAMAAGRQFYVSSQMTFDNLWDTVATRPRVFQVELNTILDPATGYQFSEDGQYLVPRAP